MYTTLIIDDEQSVHQAIRSLVDWDGMRMARPESASNGVEALARMEALRPDIAFVDMNMPLMGGVDFLSRATALYPDTRFIVVSGYDSFDYARAAIRFNVVDYLLKPIDADELDAALKKALAQLPERPEEARTPAELAEAVKRYIDENYRQSISLDTLAERFYFSREYIGRIFRAQYGCAVYEYIQQRRMEQAKALLANPRLSLQAIAEHLGYSNANYFSKAFRRHFGASPSEYRETFSP
jgi:YesN/AraC family two-component response regulator